MERQETSDSQSNPKREEQSWMASHILISKYTAKLYSLEGYGTGIKLDIQTNGVESPVPN